MSEFSDRMIPADLVVPDFYYRHIEFFPGDLVIFVLVLLVFLQAPKALSGKLFTTPVRWLTLFCLTAFFSLVFSSVRHYLLQYIRLLQYSTMILLFCAIEYIVAQNRICQLIKWIAWTVVVTLSVQCILACVQYFSQSSLGLYKIGEPPLHWFSFPNPGKQRWIFDQISHFQLPLNVLYRATGLFSHPNVLGGFLFFSLLNAFYLYVIQKKKWIKWVLTLLIFLHFLALSVSFCRAAMIACLIGTAIWTVIQYFWTENLTYRKEMKKIGLLFLISSVICLTLFYQQFFNRGGIINYNQVVRDADSERIFYQEIALKMIKANPWLGIGFNNFQLCNKPIQFGLFLCAKVHNVYLLIAAETGIIGFSFFIAFLFSILKKSIQKPFSQEQALFLSIFIGFLWIGCCDYYFVEQMYGKILFFSSLALLSAVAQKANISQSCHLKKRAFLPRS
ncbi:MAG: O-antigen ligase family protein [Chlamydiales bacterium]|nr:O-antigen ligase family protein [Chlamydiales bacterium]